MKAAPRSLPVTAGGAPVTRKAFLRQLAGGGLALGLAGCGGGGDDPPVVANVCEAGNVTANHGHALVIPRADLDSTTAKTYNIQGAAGHDHLVTITPAQFAQIKARQVVVLTSTEGLLQGLTPHAHDLSPTCA